MDYRATDYLGKARELRARRLGGTPPTPAPCSPDRDGPVATPDQDVPDTTQSADPGASTVKATRYHALITCPDRLRELAFSLQDVGRVALDLETTGLDPRQHKVRLLTLATERGTWLVDCFEVDPRPLFPVLAEKELVIHNALFDLGFLSRMGFEIGKGGTIVDTMLISQLLGVEQTEDKEDG